MLTFLGAGAVGLALLLISWNSMSKDEESLVDRAKIAWKLLVPGYAFFATIAVGLAIASAASYFGYLPGKPQVWAWLSFASLVPAWALVLADLGAPDRALSIISGFNKSSRIAWNVVLYTLLTLSLFWTLLAPSTCSAIATLAFAVLLETNLGMAFGTSKVPGWEGASKAAEFVAAAFVMLGVFTTNWQIITVSALALLLLDFWELYHVRFEDKEVCKAVSKGGLVAYYALLILAAIVAPVDAYLAAFLAFFGVLVQKVTSAYWPQKARLLKPPYSYAFESKAKFADTAEALAFLAAFLIWISVIALGLAFLG